MRYGKILGSSANPEKLAATWKGVLIGLVPLAITLARSAGWEIAEGDLVELINQVFAVISGIVVLFGLGRKLYLSR